MSDTVTYCPLVISFTRVIGINSCYYSPTFDIESFNDIDSMIDTWCSMFTAVVDMHAPVKTQRVKRNIQPDWLTSEISDSMKERDKCKKSGNLELYKTLRNKISSLIKESKKATYKSKIDEGKIDPRSIW